MSEKHKF